MYTNSKGRKANTAISSGLTRQIAALLALVLLSAWFCGCRVQTKPVITDPDVSPYIYLSTETPVPLAPDVTPEPPRTKPQKKADPIEAAEAAARLISQDAWAVDFLINLTMYGEAIYDNSYTVGLEELPVYAEGYTDFGALLKKLKVIYTSESAYAPFFKYPIFGIPQIYAISGKTYVYPHYYSNFEAKIDQGTIGISKLRADKAIFTFDILNHEFFSDGSMSMTLTADGWRLDQSFFFYCMKQLDLLDIESSVTWEENPILDTDQNIGSSKRFIGECMFYNIFIDDKATSWDTQSITRLYELQGEALRYIEEQAALFGHKLHCTATGAEDALYLNIDTDVPENADDYYWLDVFFMGTEYDSVNGLLEALYADSPRYDNYGLIFNINKQGRSYAVPCNLEYSDHADYYAERAVIYYSDDFNYEYVLSSAVIAHEILHLFGATDLYYPFDGEDIRKQIIMQYFPFELMHYVPYYAGDATISAYTAFRVGWRNTLPNQLMMFQSKG